MERVFFDAYLRPNHLEQKKYLKILKQNKNVVKHRKNITKPIQKREKNMAKE
jgi:hypothetical protein